MTRVVLFFTFLFFILTGIQGQCPSITLSSHSSSTCGTNPVTIPGNLFLNTSVVSIMKNGTGTVVATPSSVADQTVATGSPFSVTYTPGPGDFGNTVTLTFTTDVVMGCPIGMDTYTLSVLDIPAAPQIGGITGPTCLVTTGSVVLNGLPAGPWIINSNPGGMVGTGSTSSTIITGLASGSYTFTVTNSSSCISSPSASAVIGPILPVPTAPIVGTITQPGCTVATGSVNLSGLPSSGTWTLTRSPGSAIVNGSGTTTIISGLVAGTYTFTVTNSSTCISPSSANVVINAQPPTPAAPGIGTITPPTCAVPTGSVSLTGLPSGAWTVSGSPGNITLGGSGSGTTISNLGTGSYTFTVSNSFGCVSPASGNAVIPAPPPTPAAPIIGTITQPTCSVSTGSIQLNGLPAGLWTITRNPGGINTNGTGSSTSISGIASGSYTFTVTNAIGCTSPASGPAVINAALVIPTAPVIGALTQPGCASLTGSVVLSGLPPGGTWTLTESPGNILITGSGATTTVSDLSPGTYRFTVTNLSGCVSPLSGNVVIANQPGIPPAPIVGAITPPTCTLATGSVVLSGLPATGAWTLTRIPGTVTSTGTGTSTTLSGIPSGTYNYTVTNSAGCISPQSANIIIPVSPAAPTPPIISTITQPHFGTPTGSVVLNGLPSVGTWTLTLIPGNTITTGTGASTTISGLLSGTFTFTVTNSAGCISASSASFEIIAIAGSPSVIITNPSPVCFPATIDLTLPAITAGSASNLIYTYWTDVAATKPYPTPGAATSGTYYIKGTTNDGFFNIQPVIVAVYNIPVANAGPDQSLPTIFSTNMNAVLAFNYESGIWRLVSGTGVINDSTNAKTAVNGLSPGKNKFRWTVTNKVCPSSSDSVTITVGEITVPTLITPNMDGINDYFILKRSNSSEKMEIIIFDRRGVQVYKNSNYDNTWNGVDYNGKDLPDDTYFYVMRSTNGAKASGFVVIRR